MCTHHGVPLVAVCSIRAKGYRFNIKARMDGNASALGSA